MYKEIKRDNLPIKPAHIDSVIDAACSFVTFLMTGANSTQVKAIIAEADEQIEQVDEAIDKAEETINSLD
jgi:flagellin-specific chaperone FliS